MSRDDDDGAAIRASLATPHAFTAIFDRHFHAVHRFLRRRVGAAVAEDLAAETFVQAFEGRSRYRLDRDDARPWLFGIAVNLLRHHYRAEERQLRAYARSGMDPVLDVAYEAAARADAHSAGRTLAAALAELRPEERDVLLLYAWADLGYVEISEALNLPVGTVRSRLSRARETIRELLRASGQEPVEEIRSASDVTDG